MTRFVTLFALNVVHGDVSCHPVIVCPTGILANGTAVRELLKLANKDMLEGAKGMAEVLNQRDIGRPLVCAMPDCIPDPCYGDMNMCTETDTGYICSKPDETATDLQHDSAMDLQHDSAMDLQHDSAMDLQPDLAMDLQHDSAKDIRYDSTSGRRVPKSVRRGPTPS
ncbi:uncharacterized protein LOC135154398 [Lytechinus pictus]|uniref:uncharacterized protein LOC135154398 n=1 Tax=Lytechinus pictus TaxID=7653 RepID=UPI0030B9ED55